MTEYFKKFTMDKDEVTIIDFAENEVYQCKYSDEAKSLCNRLNDLDYEKYNLKKENEQLKQKIKSITEILNEDIGYIESFRKIEEVILND